MNIRLWLKHHHYTGRCRLSDQVPVKNGVIRGYENGMKILFKIVNTNHDIVPVKILKKPF